MARVINVGGFPDSNQKDLENAIKDLNSQIEQLSSEISSSNQNNIELLSNISSALASSNKNQDIYNKILQEKEKLQKDEKSLESFFANKERDPVTKQAETLQKMLGSQKELTDLFHEINKRIEELDKEKENTDNENVIKKIEKEIKVLQTSFKGAQYTNQKQIENIVKERGKEFVKSIEGEAYYENKELFKRGLSEGKSVKQANKEYVEAVNKRIKDLEEDSELRKKNNVTDLRMAELKKEALASQQKQLQALANDENESWLRRAEAKRELERSRLKEGQAKYGDTYAERYAGTPQGVSSLAQMIGHFRDAARIKKSNKSSGLDQEIEDYQKNEILRFTQPIKDPENEEKTLKKAEPKQEERIEPKQEESRALVQQRGGVRKINLYDPDQLQFDIDKAIINANQIAILEKPSEEPKEEPPLREPADLLPPSRQPFGLLPAPRQPFELPAPQVEPEILDAEIIEERKALPAPRQPFGLLPGSTSTGLELATPLEEPVEILNGEVLEKLLLSEGAKALPSSEYIDAEIIEDRKELTNSIKGLLGPGNNALATRNVGIAGIDNTEKSLIPGMDESMLQSFMVASKRFLDQGGIDEPKNLTPGFVPSARRNKETEIIDVEEIDTSGRGLLSAGGGYALTESVLQDPDEKTDFTSESAMVVSIGEFSNESLLSLKNTFSEAIKDSLLPFFEEEFVKRLAEVQNSSSDYMLAEMAQQAAIADDFQDDGGGYLPVPFGGGGQGGGKGGGGGNRPGPGGPKKGPGWGSRILNWGKNAALTTGSFLTGGIGLSGLLGTSVTGIGGLGAGAVIGATGLALGTAAAGAGAGYLLEEKLGAGTGLLDLASGPAGNFIPGLGVLNQINKLYAGEDVKQTKEKEELYQNLSDDIQSIPRDLTRAERDVEFYKLSIPTLEKELEYQTSKWFKDDEEIANIERRIELAKKQQEKAEKRVADEAAARENKSKQEDEAAAAIESETEATDKLKANEVGATLNKDTNEITPNKPDISEAPEGTAEITDPLTGESSSVSPDHPIQKYNPENKPQSLTSYLDSAGEDNLPPGVANMYAKYKSLKERGFDEKAEKVLSNINEVMQDDPRYTGTPFDESPEAEKRISEINGDFDPLEAKAELDASLQSYQDQQRRIAEKNPNIDTGITASADGDDFGAPLNKEVETEEEKPVEEKPAEQKPVNSSGGYTPDKIRELKEVFPGFKGQLEIAAKRVENGVPLFVSQKQMLKRLEDARRQKEERENKKRDLSDPLVAKDELDSSLQSYQDQQRRIAEKNPNIKTGITASADGDDFGVLPAKDTQGGIINSNTGSGETVKPELDENNKLTASTNDLLVQLITTVQNKEFTNSPTNIVSGGGGSNKKPGSAQSKSSAYNMRSLNRS